METPKKWILGLGIILLMLSAYAVGETMTRAQYRVMQDRDIISMTKIVKMDNFVELNGNGVNVNTKAVLYLPSMSEEDVIEGREFTFTQLIEWSKIEDCLRKKSKDACLLDVKKEIITFSKSNREYAKENNLKLKQNIITTASAQITPRYPLTAKEISKAISDNELNGE